MIIRQLDDSAPNRLALQQLYASAPQYYLATTGKVAAPNEAENDFADLPPGVEKIDQFIFGLYLADELIGCAGIIRGFRALNKATLTLLLLAEKHQGRGHGTRAYAELEQIMAGWPGIDTVRLGVIETNTPAFPFWRKLGFAQNGERKAKFPPYIADIIVLEKHISGEKNDLQPGRPQT
ncbi:MAG: GNAT family N-acetyltransferase [Burkholderiales bacterium]